MPTPLMCSLGPQDWEYEEKIVSGSAISCEFFDSQTYNGLFCTYFKSEQQKLESTDFVQNSYDCFRGSFQAPQKKLALYLLNWGHQIDFQIGVQIEKFAKLLMMAFLSSNIKKNWICHFFHHQYPINAFEDFWIFFTIISAWI